MIEVFFVKDADPEGGHYAIYRGVPVMSDERVTIVEVRKGEFPEKILDDIDHGAIISPHPVFHYDDLIVPYWENATVWWTREGGYVLPGSTNEVLATTTQRNTAKKRGANK